jgi:hypothetical protein
MNRLARIAVLSVFAAACQGGAGSTPSPVTLPEPAEHALGAMAAQHVAVLPTYAVHLLPGLAWTVPPSMQVRRQLDADILAALDARGLRGTWIFPEQLAQSYRRNAAYATDPYTLAEEPLRAPSFDSNVHLPEPIASQIRTLVALQQDTRLVLAPVELRLESAGAGGRGVLHLVLIDARMSNVRWVGDITSDTVPAFGPAITASIAARLASVITP